MTTTELLLIDLSAIAHQIWHTDTANPDPSRVSTQTIARVRALASQHPHAAVCCDSGKSFRADLDPAYKANRDTENRAPLKHQMTLACETLAKDGFPVWAAAGFEADDVIATAVKAALAMDPDVSVLVVSSDKDLLQLVSDRVRQKTLHGNGDTLGPDEVMAKFKVAPAQMHDYLCLVGDASDNIKGASNVGAKTAADLLAKFGDASSTFKAIFQKIPYSEAKDIYSAYAKAGQTEWKRIYKSLETRVSVTPSVFLSLVEFYPRWPTVAQLIALRTDAPIEFSEIASERTAAAMTTEAEMDESEDNTEGGDAVSGMVDMMERQIQRRMDEAGVIDPNGLRARELNAEKSAAAASAALGQAVERIKATANHTECIAEKDFHIAGRANTAPWASSPAVYAPPVDFSQQLEPRNMAEAIQLAQRMYDSRLFGAYGTPQAVLATVLAGRELGIPAMASLRAFHIIEGKPTPSADTLAALVMKSGKAKYFRCTERTPARATFVTQRLPMEDYPEQTLSFTIEEAKAAWRKDEKAWTASGWGKTPAAMLVARAKSALARLEYPDVVGNLYGFEEME